MKPRKEPIDTGTNELHQHHHATPEMAHDGAYFHLRVRDGTEMDRLLMAERISPDEYCTLEHLASDLYRANLTGLRAQSYEPHTSSGNNQDIAESAAMKRKVVNEIVVYLDHEVGEDCRQIVFGVAADEVEVRKSQDRDLHRAIEALLGYYEE